MNDLELVELAARKFARKFGRTVYFTFGGKVQYDLPSWDNLAGWAEPNGFSVHFDRVEVTA
jgi:hypothetical protein